MPVTVYKSGIAAVSESGTEKNVTRNYDTNHSLCHLKT